MAQVEIKPGICGFTTTVEVSKTGTRSCSVAVESECAHVRSLASDIKELDPFREITFRGEGPMVFQKAAGILPHPACPVPVGIIKAIEVSAGLAIPRNVEIKVTV